MTLNHTVERAAGAAAHLMNRYAYLGRYYVGRESSISPPIG